MPLRKGSSPEVIRDNIRCILEKDGCGYTPPYMDEKRDEYTPAQAAAIAYTKAGRSKKSSKAAQQEAKEYDAKNPPKPKKKKQPAKAKAKPKNKPAVEPPEGWKVKDEPGAPQEKKPAARAKPKGFKPSAKKKKKKPAVAPAPSAKAPSAKAPSAKAPSAKAPSAKAPSAKAPSAIDSGKNFQMKKDVLSWIRRDPDNEFKSDDLSYIQNHWDALSVKAKKAMHKGAMDSKNKNAPSAMPTSKAQPPKSMWPTPKPSSAPAKTPSAKAPTPQWGGSSGDKMPDSQMKREAVQAYKQVWGGRSSELKQFENDWDSMSPKVKQFHHKQALKLLSEKRREDEQNAQAPASVPNAQKKRDVVMWMRNDPDMGKSDLKDVMQNWNKLGPDAQNQLHREALSWAKKNPPKSANLAPAAPPTAKPPTPKPPTPEPTKKPLPPDSEMKKVAVDGYRAKYGSKGKFDKIIENGWETMSDSEKQFYYEQGVENIKNQQAAQNISPPDGWSVKQPDSGNLPFDVDDQFGFKIPKPEGSFNVQMAFKRAKPDPNVRNGAFGEVRFNDTRTEIYKSGDIGENEAMIIKFLEDTGVAPKFLGGTIVSKPKTVAQGYGAHVQAAKGFLGMEVAPGVTAGSLMYGPRRGSLDTKRDLADEYYRLRMVIHTKGVAHNDMHGNNFYYDVKTGKGMVIDFGLAQKSHRAALVEALGTFNSRDWQAAAFDNSQVPSPVTNKLRANVRKVHAEIKQKYNKAINLQIRSKQSELDALPFDEKEAKRLVAAIYDGVFS